MENQTAQTRSNRTAHFGGIKEWRPKREKTLELVSPMRLLDLLWKTDQEHHRLSKTEQATLSVLITYVNGNGIAQRGYESYPSGQLLVDRTGHSLRTIEDNRRALQKKDWMKIQTGRGRGHANHYFINGQKIVECYNLSNPYRRIVVQVGDAYAAVQPIGTTSIRNTDGLWRGPKMVEQANESITVDSLLQ